jgi:hypothetical protein
MNPAREVKTPRFSRKEGKTPAFARDEVRRVLDSIEAYSVRLRVLARTRTHLFARQADPGMFRSNALFRRNDKSLVSSVHISRGVPTGSPYESRQTDEELIAKLRLMFSKV